MPITNQPQRQSKGNRKPYGENNGESAFKFSPSDRKTPLLKKRRSYSFFIEEEKECKENYRSRRSQPPKRQYQSKNKQPHSQTSYSDLPYEVVEGVAGYLTVKELIELYKNPKTNKGLFLKGNPYVELLLKQHFKNYFPETFEHFSMGVQKDQHVDYAKKFIELYERVEKNLSQHGWLLRDAPDIIKKDKNLVRIAVEDWAYVLQFAAPELQVDRDIGLAAVKRSGQILKYLAPELKADRDIVLAAVKRDGLMLKFAAPELQADKDIVLTAVKECEYALYHASNNLKADFDTVMTAVKHHSRAIRHASPALLRSEQWQKAYGKLSTFIDKFTDIYNFKRSNNCFSTFFTRSAYHRPELDNQISFEEILQTASGNKPGYTGKRTRSVLNYMIKFEGLKKDDFAELSALKGLRWPKAKKEVHNALPMLRR